LLPQPLERNRFKRIFETRALNLALRGRINPRSQRPTGFLAPLARILQWDIRIGTETDHALAPRVAIPEAPEPAAGWGDEQVKPAVIPVFLR